MTTIPQTHQERIQDISFNYSLITSYISQYASQNENPVSKGDSKSSYESEALRKKGNNFLSKKEFSTACICYTQSLFSSSSALEAAYAYGNRSAALYHLGYYRVCLLDIQRCLELEYPLEKRWRLYVRAADCHARLQRSCLEEALKIVDSHQVSEINERMSHLTNTVDEYKKSHEVMELVNIRPDLPEISDTEVESLSTECGRVPTLLQVKYSEERGFGVYCTKYVAAGTPLLLEKPYSSRLHTQLFPTHCYGCFARCNFLLPCPTCSMVGFCSETCMLRCMDTNGGFPGHRYECGYMSVILQRDGHVGLLAYGCVADASCSELCSTLRYLLMEDAVNESLTLFSVSSSKSRPSLLKLKSALLLATNCKFRSKDDQMRRMQSACLYTSILEASGYFEEVNNHEKSSDSDTHMLVSLALFLFLQSVPTNAHSSSEAIAYEDLKLGLNDPKRDLVHGLYPFLSLINHACDPNVVRIGYNGSSIVLFTLRPIHIGEELMDNYSIHYALLSNSQRREELQKQYHFQCDCVACRENWPTFEELAKEDSFKFRCNSFSGNEHRATECISAAQEKAHTLFDKVLSNGSQNHDMFHQLIYTLVTYSELLHEHVHKPHKEFDFVSETLKWSFQLVGNRSSF